MHPDQPTGHNPYDFIFQEKPKQKLKLVPRGNSTSSRLLVAALGFGVIVIALVLFIALLTAGKGEAIQKMTLAAKDQNEIIRIASIGVDKAQGRDAKDLAITTQYSMTSDQNILVTNIQKAGKKLSDKQLALSKNSQNDASLSAAEQANQFDSSFTTLLNQLITKYQQDLSDAYKSAKTKTTKTTLIDLNNHAKVLLNQPV